MRKPLITFSTVLLALACGPETSTDDDIPGELEYEQLYNRVYRLDRRIDVIKELPGEDGERRDCGILTDRAYADLEGTLAALDPSVDYSNRSTDCSPHGALVHVDGLEHSPFECSFECCHPDLHWAAIVYVMSLNNLSGIGANLVGEPYIAIEPDQPCP